MEQLLPPRDAARFDMARKVEPTAWYLRPLIWLLTFPAVLLHNTKIEREGMEGVKPPYLLLCNHNAFYDFSVATVATFPHRVNYVVAIDGYIGREWLMRKVGCVCKRKFTSDLVLVRQLKRVIDSGNIACVYPEARYSLCGTTAVLPESLGKLCKLLGVPVVTLITRGHHVDSPFWNLKKRGNRTEAKLSLTLTKDEVKALSVEGINAMINDAFYYDDFAWQRENGVRVRMKGRAEGLDKVLYQCPHCKAEYRMASKDDALYCEVCGKRWKMGEYGELAAVSGETEFSHIPDWYEWERANVAAEVEAGTYRFEGDVYVDSLPNAKGYVHLGRGRLAHDGTGFTLTGSYRGEAYSHHWDAATLYSCHIEYAYLGKYGDCVDLNTLTDTMYIYPEGKDFSVTKLALATEELYRHSHLNR
ncbi:MAG TPA: 1-acyl-sn-glycerol-3-phosphate acyltransferase [Clostridia bacterium]|nr:1-acyl-sn-glycerol-3-phosphate acyltransferase [Clostridia bacterium]